jgi:hypothetical protein
MKTKHADLDKVEEKVQASAGQEHALLKVHIFGADGDWPPDEEPGRSEWYEAKERSLVGSCGKAGCERAEPVRMWLPAKASL